MGGVQRDERCDPSWFCWVTGCQSYLAPNARSEFNSSLRRCSRQAVRSTPNRGLSLSAPQKILTKGFRSRIRVCFTVSFRNLSPSTMCVGRLSSFACGGWTVRHPGVLLDCLALCKHGVHGEMRGGGKIDRIRTTGMSHCPPLLKAGRPEFLSLIADELRQLFEGHCPRVDQ